MSRPPLSRDTALRIGLAAKALPNMSPKHLLALLIDCCELPLTTQKLDQVSYSEYRKLLHKRYALENVRSSLAYLQGKASISNRINAIKIYRPGDMPGSIRVAASSNDGINISCGFCEAEKFYIYQLSADEIRLIAIRSADAGQSLKSEQKQRYLAEMIEDCQLLYSAELGGRAAAKLVNKEVHAIKVARQTVITEVLLQLQYVLGNSPPPWLAKSMNISTVTQHTGA